MMYLVFRYKGWEPSKYNAMGRGEKTVVSAFMKVEIEDRKKNMTDLFG